MDKRIIGGVLLLCAAACLMSWAEAQSQSTEKSSQPAAKPATATPAEKPGKGRAQPPAVAVPKNAPPVKTSEVPEAAKRELTARERAIRAQSAALIADYNAKAADGFVGRFLPDAEYELNNGEVMLGREAIRDYFTKSFEAHPQARARSTDSRIRLVSQHMAIEEGSNTISQDEGSPGATCGYVAIWAFSEGQWRLASVRDLPADDLSDTAHSRLEPLAWLVGDWVEETPESLVKVTCRWSPDKNFLLQDYTVKVQGSEVVSGTQRIGWDPLTRKIRGWLFDSHGGYGESFWNWDGERWIIRSSAVRTDGTTVASLNYLMLKDENSYQWESSHRMSGDQPLPDVSLLIVRQAPLPAATLPEPKN